MANDRLGSFFLGTVKSTEYSLLLRFRKMRRQKKIQIYTALLRNTKQCVVASDTVLQATSHVHLMILMYVFTKQLMQGFNTKIY